jgi:hypothetical protein
MVFASDRASTGVRRETAGEYLRVAGIALRCPGEWGRHGPAKPAIDVITGFLVNKTGLWAGKPLRIVP